MKGKLPGSAGGGMRAPQSQVRAPSAKSVQINSAAVAAAAPLKLFDYDKVEWRRWLTI